MARDEDLIRGYAEALFSVARAEGALPTVEDELYGFAKGLEQHTALREALTDAALPAENKKAVIAEVLGDRANPVTVSLLGFIVDAGRAREIPAIVERLAQVAASERDHALAEVRSAVELTEAQRDRIAAGAVRGDRPHGRREGRRRPLGRGRHRGPRRRRGLRRVGVEPARVREATPRELNAHHGTQP